MGIADMFGFGKKVPFRTPREVAEIRNKIAAELRENYPNLARYREIKNEVAAGRAADERPYCQERICC